MVGSARAGPWPSHVGLCATQSPAPFSVVVFTPAARSFSNASRISLWTRSCPYSTSVFIPDVSPRLEEVEIVGKITKDIAHVRGQYSIQPVPHDRLKLRDALAFPRRIP